MEVNGITERIIGAAIAVHRALGPGLLEATYEACLAAELEERGLEVQRQHPIPVVYKNVRLECGYRVDILVNRAVILELKAVSQLDPIHSAQLLTYLRLSGLTTGLLINFNVKRLTDGLHRFVI